MRTWTFPARVERQREDDFVVAFPEIPEIVTGGGSFKEALANAEDALEEAVLEYLASGRLVPSPRPAREGEHDVVLAPSRRRARRSPMSCASATSPMSRSPQNSAKARARSGDSRTVLLTSRSTPL